MGKVNRKKMSELYDELEKQEDDAMAKEQDVSADDYDLDAAVMEDAMRERTDDAISRALDDAEKDLGTTRGEDGVSQKKKDPRK